MHNPIMVDGSTLETTSANNLNCLEKPTNQPSMSRPGKNLSSKWESRDYAHCENELHVEEEQSKGYNFIVRKNVWRWMIMVFVGIFTGLFTATVEIIIDKGTEYKYLFLRGQLDQGKKLEPFAYWALINCALVLVASSLVTFVEPVAGGSGIPQLKCYLNGVRVPRLYRLKTLAVKGVAVICSVVGGLAVGKEPAASNSGTVFAASLSQGIMPSIKKDLGFFSYFREHREKRDFVSGGAAAGVAAAFGAPFGGLLFALEEGCSFWNQELAWRMLLAAMVTVFSMNSVLSAYHGRTGELSYSGLLGFGTFGKTVSYNILEIPIFVLMGVIGGLTGALYNWLNIQLRLLRLRFLPPGNYPKVLEALLCAIFSASMAIMMILAFPPECHPISKEENEAPNHPLSLGCPIGHQSTVGGFWLQQPEASLRSLFHDRSWTHSTGSLLIFAVAYFLLSAWTMGLSSGSGLYIPTLLVGAAWGRVVAQGVSRIFPNEHLDFGKYAVIGGAAQLGGILRMTLCLTAILVEGTGSIGLGLPIMITLNVAKWVGDWFTEGFYDIQIQFMGAPILGWEPPPLSTHVKAKDVMSPGVVTMREKENVGRICQILSSNKHNGFPILGDEERFRGMILRSQLLTMLLHHDLFTVSGRRLNNPDLLALFRDPFAKPELGPLAKKIYEEGTDLEEMDLSLVMNPAPSCYTVEKEASLPKIFTLFRSLGLRHLIVVRGEQVKGIISRIDLAKYRVKSRFGRITLKETGVCDI